MLGERQRVWRIGTVIAMTVAAIWTSSTARADDPDRIRPYEAHPQYWQYKGKPVLLLGGSDDDNLFQWEQDKLAAQLDLLVSAGGNYVRNTMSCRDEGNVFPFARTADGRFDLDRWDDAYWRRLHRLLTLAYERGVIVQIELWDPHDYYRDIGELGGWSRQPFRPANNINYTLAESGLIDVVDWSAVHDPEKDHPFFQSAPAERDLALVRQYQERLVAKVLEVAISFPNVLYCVSNESNDVLAWSDYWAAFLRREANARGGRIEVGEMRFPRTPHHDDIRHLIARADLYDFLDISQMNRPARQEHWDHLMYLRRALADRPRPLNNTKIYGSDEVAWTGGYRTGEECFWRDVLGGCASARFHRPTSGRGLDPQAQRHIRSARLLTDAMNVFACAPRDDLLSERSPNEAYCLAEPGKRYAVYFPDGGEVKLDVSGISGRLQVRWLDIARSVWQESQQIQGGATLDLKSPANGHWAALVLAR